MIEVRIHGRGGQGNVVAAYLLATAAISEGWHALAFPNFGAERRGAPVTAFVRMAEKPFRRRDQIATPDFLLIQDESLLHVPALSAGLKPAGGVLINSRREAAALAGLPEHARVQPLSASDLARQHLRRDMPNVALLAGFLSLTGVLPLGALANALQQRFSGEVLQANLALAEAAAGAVAAGAWEVGQ